MNVHTLLRRRRMFVLLGVSTITVFSAYSNWRGHWILSDWQTHPTPEDLSSDFLAGVLKTYRNQRHLPAGCQVHWFLPPDMLAVVFLPSNKTAEGLVLPFQAEQVQTTLFDACMQGEVWLWMHQSWASLLERAAEQAQCHTLYAHPRVMLVALPNSLEQQPPGPAANAWSVVIDGAYQHIFNGNRSLRSMALGRNAAVDGDTPSDSPNQLTAPQEGRMRLETESIISAWTGAGALDDSVQMRMLGYDVDALVSASAKPAQAFACTRALSSASLHAGGLLLGSLTPVAERRIWAGVVAVMMVAVTFLGGAYVHYQQAGEIRNQAIETAKTRAPDARRLPEVKQDIRRKEDFLLAAHDGLKTPDVLQALGRVVETLPAKATLHTFKADDTRVTVQISIVKGGAPSKVWPLKDSAYADLSLQPDEEANMAGQASIHTYQAPAKASAP